MKKILMFVVFSAVALADDKKADAAKTAQANEARPEGIPAGAQLVEPNLYRYTDSKGVTWLYSRGAVGVTKRLEQQQPEPKKAATGAKQERQDAIPAGAELVEPGLYRHTDKKGVAWLYRQTPFGVSKWEEKPAQVEPVASDPSPTVVTDLGDSVQFVKNTPFGPQKWVHKKSELTESEKQLLKAKTAVPEKN
jgi:hypothetical protein